jgi:hypothetical protein
LEYPGPFLDELVGDEDRELEELDKLRRVRTPPFGEVSTADDLVANLLTIWTTLPQDRIAKGVGTAKIEIHDAAEHDSNSPLGGLRRATIEVAPIEKFPDPLDWQQDII